MGFHIVVFLVGQQLRHRPLALLRHTAGNQFVQDGQHLIPAHGTALQQDLTYCKDLAVIEQRQSGLLQPVATLSLVVDNILLKPLFGKKTAQRFHVTLDTPLRDMKLLRQFFFRENIPADQPGIDLQQTF